MHLPARYFDLADPNAAFRGTSGRDAKHARTRRQRRRLAATNTTTSPGVILFRRSGRQPPQDNRPPNLAYTREHSNAGSSPTSTGQSLGPGAARYTATYAVPAPTVRRIEVNAGPCSLHGSACGLDDRMMMTRDVNPLDAARDALTTVFPWYLGTACSHGTPASFAMGRECR